jgi:hypothetical protein
MTMADIPADPPTAPTCKRLLDDIRSRKIDVIVVYKVDRLTRSLADFARLVELFDAHGVSFVSVTQQFCAASCEPRLAMTTTSGRIGHWIKMRRCLARFSEPEH